MTGTPDRLLEDNTHESADSAVQSAHDLVDGNSERPRQTAKLEILVVAKPGSFDKNLVPGLTKLGYDVAVASSQIEAVRCLASCHTDVLITDMCFDDSAGISIVDICRSTRPECEVVLATDWAARLLASGSAILEVDHIVSAMCRLDEIVEILEEHQKRTGCR